MEFFEYQEQTRETENLGQEDIENNTRFTAFGLIEQAGKIAQCFKKQYRDKKAYSSLDADLEDRIGHLLWYVATLVNIRGLDLNTIAETNLAFNRERWGTKSPQRKFFHDSFDENFPSSQRLPKQFTVLFTPDIKDGLKKISVTIDGKPFGDSIDDNSYREDGYRFHDVLHLSFVAHLKWSPVVRKLMKCKRKENGEKDRVEDGARARDTEEAISRYVFAYAVSHNNLENINVIDTNHLRGIQSLIKGLEVEHTPIGKWQDAIINAFEIIRFLKHTEAPTKVVVSMDEERIKLLKN